MKIKDEQSKEMKKLIYILVYNYLKEAPVLTGIFDFFHCCFPSLSIEALQVDDWEVLHLSLFVYVSFSFSLPLCVCFYLSLNKCC